jgi:hypothetical protein
VAVAVAAVHEAPRRVLPEPRAAKLQEVEAAAVALVLKAHRVRAR